MEKKFEKMIAKSNLIVLPIILFLMVIISIVIVANSTDLMEKEKANYVEMSEIEDVESNINRLVKIKVTEIKCLVIKGTDVEFYVVSDGNKNYLIDIYNYNYDNMVKEIQEKGSFDFYGITSIVVDSFKERVVQKYNEKVKDANVELNKYNEEFGTLFLSQSRNIFSYTKILSIAFWTFSIFELFLIFIFSSNMKNILKTRKKLSREEMKEMREQIKNNSTILLEKINIVITDKYIIDLSKGFTVIKLEDIIWTYPYNYNRVNFFKDITVYENKNNTINTYKLGTTKKVGKKIELLFVEAFKAIAERCPNALLGNSEENRIIIENKYKIKNK